MPSAFGSGATIFSLAGPAVYHPNVGNIRKKDDDPMNDEFPAAVPEIPVSDMDQALDYYRQKLGFNIDWGGADGGIAGISKGQCRMFLTDRDFRQHHGNAAPVVIWLNLESKEEVDELFEIWQAGGARIISPPESKPWKLHEFTASDLDGNLFRVFYDFSSDL